MRSIYKMENMRRCPAPISWYTSPPICAFYNLHISTCSISCKVLWSV